MLLSHRSTPLYKLPTFTDNFMGSKHFLLNPKVFPPSSASSSSSRTHLFHTYRLIFFAFPSKPNSQIHPYSIRASGFSFRPNHASVTRPASEAYLENLEEKKFNLEKKSRLLKQKFEVIGIDCGPCRPGQYIGLLCPKCKGGESKEKSLSLLVTPDGEAALWTCFRAKCGWRGSTRAFADLKSSYGKMKQITKVKQTREIKEKSLDLEPLCSQLLAYFSARLITEETLQRNYVMQRRYGDQIVIAFPYRRNGAVVSCKYRDINKKFWQEADTEKIFYGLDDVEGASDIIIVEGEMDKLAMEEAGFRNCVSVPDGAPPSVSNKALPSEEEDTKYQYLWNCKEYLEKASRIILATDGDSPGQALAEELARRLGR